MAKPLGSSPLDTRTIEPDSVHAATDIVAPALTIVFHPDTGRIGERSMLNDPGGEGQVRVSRLMPAFGAVGSERYEPLADPQVSRTPFLLDPRPDGSITVIARARASRVVVGGTRLEGSSTFRREALQRGVVLEVAGRVVLLLHLVRPLAERPPPYGLLGESAAILEVRQQIERVAKHGVAVLLRGESGTGKELAARAIHERSPRAGKPFVTVNMAAIPASTAASALFGHARGAFTGADSDSKGYFRKADGGTLFLDEIGDTPEELQPALLRALDSGELQPLGFDEPIHCDVRVVAATDADLQAAVAAGRFRLPLLQRLSGLELVLPPLRERREDIARLFLYFVRQELEPIERLERLAPPSARGRPWLPVWLMAALVEHAWPGNVRQLRNVARQLAVHFADEDEIPRGSVVDRLLGLDALPEPAPRRAPNERKPPGEVSEMELKEALRRHDYKPSQTARELGLSRTTLYALIERSESIRKARDLDAAEITSALAEHGDTASAARALEVSARGLRLRMKELGL